MRNQFFPERFSDHLEDIERERGSLGEIFAEIRNLPFVSAFIDGKKTDEKIKMRLEFANNNLLNSGLDDFSAWLSRKGMQSEKQAKKIIIKLIEQGKEKVIELEFLVENIKE